MNKEIRVHWNALQEKKKQISEIEQKIKRTHSEIEKMNEALNRQKAFIQRRLKSLWEFGPLGTLNVIFSSHSLGELYSNQQYLVYVIENDQQIRKKYIMELKALRKKKLGLEKEKDNLIKLTQEIQNEVIELEEARETKRTFLEDLESQEKGYRNLIASLQETEKGITTLVQKLKSNKKVVKEPQSRFEENIGKLTPPIFEALRVLTPKLHPMVPRNGVVFEAPLGTPVRTIFDGVVKFVGRVKGYETVIIIDHGGGYMSLTGYLNQAFVHVRQRLLEGDTIGIAGTGGFIESGAYLEIRKNGEPIDPLRYIDLKGIPIE
ncbi:Peptidase family M23/M37 [Dissulfuribacter thermophilus]|uniref:Peptidase family M23/M37 n=1 Tax=Dissulfuribacter thermophilus TaxID=1156395 RepID=A0A1B9F8F8_9BACT|nr:peptidoglycan DD-metalloendopeptidase family protein [Dissulfuribacter thermophilus]OCC16061.1 Peptidase family M23/M37 [Dissulfuribacter thermophilus]